MKFVVFLLLSISVIDADYQHVTVKGRTICDGRLMRDVLVELWEKDTFDPDDLLASVHSDRNGQFVLSGGEDEIFSIEPIVRISHYCRANAGCMRINEFIVPEDRINGEVYDMTFISLNIAMPNEKEKCC